MPPGWYSGRAALRFGLVLFTGYFRGGFRAWIVCKWGGDGCGVVVSDIGDGCIGGSAFGTMVDFRFATIPRPVPFHGPGVPSLRSGREKEIEPIDAGSGHVRILMIG